jgi:Uma2 family endonuclease
MVALKEHFLPFTPAEYLAWEDLQEFRHEYVDGQIYAMTGGTVNHGRIALNIGSILSTRLRGSGCMVLNSDVKVQVLESNSISYCYPDISVTCDERDRHADKFISHPCLIIEALSLSTEAYDRSKKFRKYRRSATLQEYVLVSTNDVCLDVYRRNDRGKWEVETYLEGDLVELQSINLTVAIEQIYEDIIFSAEVFGQVNEKELPSPNADSTQT